MNWWTEKRARRKVKKCEPWIKLTPPDYDANAYGEEEYDELYIRGRDVAEVSISYYASKERPWLLEILTAYDCHYKIGEFSTKGRATTALVEFLREVSNNKYGVRVTEMKKEGEF